MNRRTILVALLAILVLVGGWLAYRYSTRAAAGADCGDKPKPKDEFTMAAPCDTGGEAPKPASPAAPR